MNLKRITALFAIIIITFAAKAVEPGNYIEKDFISSTGFKLLYREASPANAEGPLPLIVMMHGLGERGDDNLKQLTLGGPRLQEAADSGKAIVIFPQCPDSYFWAYDSVPRQLGANSLAAPEKPTAPIVAVKELIDSLANSGAVDPKRIYLCGISMGGMAVWDMIVRWPEMPAAATIMCGAVNPTRLKDFCSRRGSKLPIRVFHGSNDKLVPASAAKQAVKALRQCGESPELTIYPGVGHGCWVNAFAEPDFIDWFFKFKNR